MALTGLTKVTNIGINTTTIPTLGGSRNTGVVTATTFVGDGSGLSGVTGSGAGVIVRDGGSLVGTAGTINFGTNLNVSAISAGIVTVTNAASATALTNLSDVTISSASNGQILKHNGSVFVNTAETTYSQSSVASGSNVNLRLTDSGGTNDDILITAGSNITFSSVTANGFTIAASGGGGGGGLSNVVEDTTPQLGGALDLNNKFITGSGGINVSGVTTSTSFVGNITGNVTGNADTATNSTHVYVTENGSTDENNLIAFVEDAQTSTGNHGLEMDSDLTFNPSTGNLTATKFTGSGVALTGVVTSIVAGSNITLTGGPTGIVTISSSGGGGGGSVSLSGSTNNTVATVTGANALIGEANLTFDGSTLGIAAGSSDNKIQIDGTNPYIQFREGTTNKAYVQWSSGGYFQLGNEEAGEVLRIGDGESGLIWRVGSSNRTVWTSGNDGASSGLDSDLLDGQEGSYYTNASNISSGTLAAARVATLNQDTTGNAGTATTATTATQFAVTSNNTTDETVYPVFVDGNSGTQGAEVDTAFTYNPSTNTLTSGSFVKSGGSSSQFLKADGSVDSNTYLTSGSYLENVVEDTTPQLGGDLDLNSKNITGTGNAQIVGVITATSAVPTWTLGASGTDHYTFTGNGFTSATNDPDIYLVRGQRYAFLNNSGGNHPFQIQSDANSTAYNTGVTRNNATSGYITFNVPMSAPAHLYYKCSNHPNMLGNIYVVGQHLANGGNDRIITATSAYGMNAESDLQFDGTNLFMPSELRHLGDPDTKIGFDNNAIRVETAGSERLRFASDGVIHVNSPSSSEGGRIWGNSSKLYLQSGNGRQSIIVNDAGAGVNRSIEMTSDGNLSFPSGNGIDFSATGDASGKSSEVLDDYEEGSWTPSWGSYGGSQATGAFTYSAQNGIYTKVGRICHCSFYMAWSAMTTLQTGSYATIDGLPFTVGSVSGHLGASEGATMNVNWFNTKGAMINGKHITGYAHRTQTRIILGALGQTSITAVAPSNIHTGSTWSGGSYYIYAEISFIV